MRPADELARFVREALSNSRSRPEIDAALRDAGWSTKERTDALSTYADTDFVPPVPRPRPYVSAKDAFMYGLLFVALGASAIALNGLFFSLISLWLPKGTSAYEYKGALDGIRMATATLVFTAPLFLWLTYLTGKAIGKDAGKRRSAIRKILIYLTLFITALVVISDLVTLVYYLLRGDTTLRFLLKALSVGAISGAIFAYYLKDATMDERGDAS